MEPFLPLNAAPASTGDRPNLRVTVVSQMQNTQTFKPLSHSAASIAAAHKADCEPRVTLQRDGNRISGIQIQCNCGQAIELACVYDPA
jgi:hypothetical protein